MIDFLCSQPLKFPPTTINEPVRPAYIQADLTAISDFISNINWGGYEGLRQSSYNAHLIEHSHAYLEGQGRFRQQQAKSFKDTVSALEKKAMRQKTWSAYAVVMKELMAFEAAYRGGAA